MNTFEGIILKKYTSGAKSLLSNKFSKKTCIFPIFIVIKMPAIVPIMVPNIPTIDPIKINILKIWFLVNPKDLKTTVNPVKTLTPRFITRTLEKISN